MKKTTILLITLLLTLPVFCQSIIDSFYRTGTWYYSTDPPNWQTRVFKPKAELVITSGQPSLHQLAAPVKKPIKDTCGKKQQAVILKIIEDFCDYFNCKTIWINNIGGDTETGWLDVKAAGAKKMAATQSIQYDNCNIYTKNSVVPIVRKSNNSLILSGSSFRFYISTSDFISHDTITVR